MFEKHYTNYWDISTNGDDMRILFSEQYSLSNPNKAEKDERVMVTMTIRAARGLRDSIDKVLSDMEQKAKANQIQKAAGAIGITQ